MRYLLVLVLTACTVKDPVFDNPSDPYRPRIFDKGDRGDKGDIGPMGPAGPIGPQGIVGPQGERGERGEAGSIGPIGPMGPQGAIGIGLQGIQGEHGPQGLQGPQGAIGPKGDKGEKGDVGGIGPQGLKGADGVCKKFFGNSDVFKVSITIPKNTTRPPAVQPSCNQFSTYLSIVNGWGIRTGSDIINCNYPFYFYYSSQRTYALDVPNLTDEAIENFHIIVFFRDSLADTGWQELYFGYPRETTVSDTYTKIAYAKNGKFIFTFFDEWTSNNGNLSTDIKLDLKVVVIQ